MKKTILITISLIIVLISKNCYADLILGGGKNIGSKKNETNIENEVDDVFIDDNAKKIDNTLEKDLEIISQTDSQRTWNNYYSRIIILFGIIFVLFFIYFLKKITK